MIMYSGAEGWIWAVASIGTHGQQIAALTSSAVVIWNRDDPAPVQVLAWGNDGREHSSLHTSADGNWLVGVSGHGIRYLCKSRTGWSLSAEEGMPGLCAACFVDVPATFAKMCVYHNDAGQPELRLMKRLQNRRRGLPFDKTVISFPSAPFTCGGGADLRALHWYAADLSADGRWFMVTAGEKLLHVWQACDGGYVGQLKLKGLANEARFSPDGTLLAVDVGTSVYICRTPSLEVLAVWKVNYCYIPELAWSPDGRHLARADTSTTVRVFDIESGREAYGLGVPRQRATSVAYAPDGLTRLVGTTRGAVIVWDVD